MSMNSKGDIINLALILSGIRPSTGPSEQTKSTQFANARYEGARDFVLSRGNWNSATKRVALTKLSTTPAWGFSSEFQLPADFMRLLVPENLNQRFRIEAGKTLVCDTDTFNITYIFKLIVVQEMDELLKNAIAYKLAADTVLATKAELNQAQLLNAQFEQMVTDAMYIDNLQAPTDQYVGDTFDVSRRAGTGETFRPIESATSS